MCYRRRLRLVISVQSTAATWHLFVNTRKDVVILLERELYHLICWFTHGPHPAILPPDVAVIALYLIHSQSETSVREFIDDLLFLQSVTYWRYCVIFKFKYRCAGCERWEYNIFHSF